MATPPRFARSATLIAWSQRLRTSSTRARYFPQRCPRSPRHPSWLNLRAAPSRL
jgi:hypothetical protein